ncbi:MAG: phosphohydrolase [Desulfobacterales bacterium]|nr:MAG: phosphohydrolase [Desulfobacterales bacterium]
MLNEKEKLETFAQLGIDLNQVQGLDILMERILTEARRFVNADAGSIYRREDESLRFSYTQNDTLQKRLPPGEKLLYSKFSIPIDDSSIAGYVAGSGKLLNIPDVYAIASTCPYGFQARFDRKSNYRTKSMLTIPLKNVNQDIIGVIQMINALDNEGNPIPFSDDDEGIMRLFAGIASVPLERALMTRSMILRMIDMAKMRDPKETGMHAMRVGQYSIEIYERWAIRRRRSLDRKDIDRNRDILSLAAMLHDVGKVGIPDRILKKNGRLDEEEYNVMKRHTILGARLFAAKESDLDKACAEIALNHHERWDGRGYPGILPEDLHSDAVGMVLDDVSDLPGKGMPGKAGKEIPLFARIVAIADVYDALSSRRVYKSAWEKDRVLDYFHQEAGGHFDPELVDIFWGCTNIFQKIQQEYQD